MYFILAIMFVMIGVSIAGVCALLPLDMLVSLELSMPGFGILFVGMGLLLSMVGMIMLWIRAIKVGANHLIAPGRPDKILWFYFFKDDSVKIIPARRDVEGLLYSKKLDASVQEVKAYHLFDHPVRFVPEGLGHTADLNACLYAYFIKSKFGFKTIKEAREQGEISSKEKVMDGNELEDAYNGAN